MRVGTVTGMLGVRTRGSGAGIILRKTKPTFVVYGTVAGRITAAGVRRILIWSGIRSYAGAMVLPWWNTRQCTRVFVLVERLSFTRKREQTIVMSVEWCWVWCTMGATRLWDL